MDICPKCHNRIVYGMNCCTGKRLLNQVELESRPARELACAICGSDGWGHDQWKHVVMGRIEALEKEVAGLKKNALEKEIADLSGEGQMAAQSPQTKLLLRRALSQCSLCFEDHGIYARTFTSYTCTRCSRTALHVGPEVPLGCPDCMRESGTCSLCGKKAD